MAKKVEPLWRHGIPPAQGSYPGFRPGYRIDSIRGIRCEYDVAVPMRDGVKICVDIFRPAKEGKYPVLIEWSPYGKHVPPHVKYASFPPGTGQPDVDTSEYCAFEGADPGYWCPHDYIVINVDPRGCWGSEGTASYFSPQETEDCYDLIEWAGVQEWSNGKVGMSGVSYLAVTQWKVAALNPPHLAAINPYEGLSDIYRELYFHGGMPSDGFASLFFSVGHLFIHSNGMVEDIESMLPSHPLYDDYWESKNCDLSKITVPAYVVACWSDHGLHTRGTLEGFKRISSKDKWLRVHGGKKWQDFYLQKDSIRQFFDKFLKGIDSEVKHWPKVTLQVRERYFVGNFRSENEWPLARTKYEKLYLDAGEGHLSKSPFEKTAKAIYNVDDPTDKSQNIQFEYKFDAKTELTGYMKLKLWVSAVGCDDMDLFVTIEKINRRGEKIDLPGSTVMDNGCVAFGWLRASHRELDEKESTPYQPYLKHKRLLKLQPGEVVPVEIEIWPSSTLFEAGEKLQIVVQGSDIRTYGPFYPHTLTVNKGKHEILTGGKYDSHLLIPVIP